MTLGVAIGKFYPPHRGHRHLIERGRGGADEMVVIVCHRAGQAIPGDVRARWIEEMVPGVRALVTPDDLPGDDSRAWAERTRDVLGRAPDLVFTSEEYGPRYAAILKARHVMVDPGRHAVPISATEVRRDPLAAWAYLDPCVRAWFARRVVLVGAESTGKTTLARDLAEHYGTAWVPEFGRAHSDARPEGPWQSAEFERIAREQDQREDAAARVCERILVCDTDSFATAIWHERYVGHRSAAVEAIAAKRRPDLYLLAGSDAPFVQDGTRDGEHLRGWMEARFREELPRRNVPWIELRGDHAARRRGAIEACDRLLAEVRPL